MSVPTAVLQWLPSPAQQAGHAALMLPHPHRADVTSFAWSDGVVSSRCDGVKFISQNLPSDLTSILTHWKVFRAKTLLTFIS